MLVRMSHWECRPEYWGEEVRLFRSGSIAVMRKHEGFVRAMLLAVPGTTHRIAFTAWETEEHYRAFVASPDLKTIRETFAHMDVEGTAPSPIEYVVLESG